MFDLDHIITKYRHPADVLEQTGLDAQVLEAIYNDHAKRMAIPKTWPVVSSDDRV